MKKWIERIVKRWAAKKYRRIFEKKVRFYETVYVKKGKVREWRTFDMNGVRMSRVIR